MADRSVFDGYSLTLYRSDGSVVGSWPAISGRNGNQRPSDQNLPFKGPLTEGTYSFSTVACSAAAMDEDPASAV